MKTILALILFIGLLLGAISATSAILPKSPFLAGIAILEFGALSYALFWWFAREIVYQCLHCGRYFALSPLSSIMAINAIDTRFVRCPSCSTSDFDKAYSRREVQAEIIEPGQIKPPKDGNWRGFYAQMAILTFVVIIAATAIYIMRQNLMEILARYNQGLHRQQQALIKILSAVGALYLLYLGVFISALRHRYKTGIHTALTVILSVIYLIILLAEYSHYREFIQNFEISG